MQIKQYNIYEVDLTNPSKSQASKKIVNAAILSPDVMNDVLKTVIIAPLSKCCAITPTTFLINEDTRIRIDLISSIPKKRVLKSVGKIDSSQIPKIKDVIDEMLVK